MLYSPHHKNEARHYIGNMFTNCAVCEQSNMYGHKYVDIMKAGIVAPTLYGHK